MSIIYTGHNSKSAHFSPAAAAAAERNTSRSRQNSVRAINASLSRSTTSPYCSTSHISPQPFSPIPRSRQQIRNLCRETLSTLNFGIAKRPVIRTFTSSREKRSRETCIFLNTRPEIHRQPSERKYYSRMEGKVYIHASSCFSAKFKVGIRRPGN